MSTPEHSLDRWSVMATDPSIQIKRTGTIPVLDANSSAEIDTLWKHAIEENSALFNGTVFSVDHVTPSRLAGHWTEYKRIFAQFRIGNLNDVLMLKPLAVAGLVEGPDGIIFGRRPLQAVYQPDIWQLAPAGNVDRGAADGDRIDFVKALEQELLEELGMPATAVSAPRSICLVQHPRSHIVDLCVAVRTEWDAPAIRRAHRDGGDGEYPEIAIVPRPDLEAFIAGIGSAMAPQVPLFLRCYGALRV